MHYFCNKNNNTYAGTNVNITYQTFPSYMCYKQFSNTILYNYYIAILTNLGT